MKQKKITTVYFTEETLKKIEDIEKETGVTGTTSVVAMCINFYHKKEIDNYVGAIKTRPAKAMTDDDKIKKTEDRKEKELQYQIEQCENIAKELNAVIFTNETGVKTARWNIYEKGNEYNVSISEVSKALIELSDFDIEKQYREATKSEIEEMMSREEVSISRYK